MIRKSMPSGHDRMGGYRFSEKDHAQQRAGAGWRFEEGHHAPASLEGSTTH